MCVCNLVSSEMTSVNHFLPDMIASLLLGMHYQCVSV